MSNTPNLRLPYLDANQNQKTVTHNAALRMLDALVNLRVASAALSAPPAAPNDGQCWIVAPGGSGAWLGKDLNVAAWQDGAWCFYAPNPGFVAYVDALGGALMWNGTAWVSLLGAIASLALSMLGVGTAADPANPLSARLNAALFAALPTTASPAGTGDVRVKLSKQGSGNAATVLFQDNYSGRAEIGLAGDDSFHVRVSPDGASFTDALVAASGGAVSFPLTPTAPTAPAGDSSGRLATTGFVMGQGFVTAAGAAAAAPVASVAGRTGAVALAVADVAGAAPLASPALTGTPTAPNPAAGTNSAQLATTSFVAASFLNYASAAATYATLANATLTGTPTAPTPAAKDNSTKLATTAYADRGDAAQVARTQVNDASYTVLATDRTVAVIALTAPRTLTLPAASAFPQGAMLTLVDESGGCSTGNVVTVACAGSDTLNGGSAAALARPYALLALQSNGVNKWTLVEQIGAMAVAAPASVNNSASGAGAAFVHAPAVTLPANFLQVGRAVRVFAALRLTTGSAPPALTVQLRAGTTAVCTLAAVTPAASRTNVTFGLGFVLQATGAPGGSAAVECAPAGNTNAYGGGAGVVNEVAMPVALATNAALPLNLLTTWSAAGTGTSTVQLSQLLVEVLT